jgi:UDP-2-acetamido-2-deoxy-ribo-hexuluronate aminotransferase
LPERIDFIDLKAQQQLILPALMARLQTVLAHGRYIMGPEIKELEERLAAYVGVKHCLSCSSGTDALLMSLMAQGVGPGDAILTSPFTFIATAEVIQLLGATPVFVDIDPDTFNMRPLNLAETINDLARKHGLFVLEDAAQSFGAAYRGKRAGSLAEVAATSFFPAKPLGGYGDGGAIFTDNDELAEILRSIRVHGQGAHKYENVRLGLNGRLDTLQAAILLAKLEVFDAEVQSRQKVAQRYSRALQDKVKVPAVEPECTSVWAQYSILSEDRSALQQKLTAAGIPTAIYYPIPLHLQKAFASLGYRPGDFEVSERIAQQILSLPMHPYLTEATQDRIIEVLLS